MMKKATKYTIAPFSDVDLEEIWFLNADLKIPYRSTVFKISFVVPLTKIFVSILSLFVKYF